MEVLVKGLPDQMTERNVEKEFRPILERFGIKIFHCQKLRSRGYALITFLDRNKGNSFLVAAYSGQRKFLGQPGVVLRGKSLSCTLSRNEPDPYLIKSLKKEESDQYQALIRKPRIVPGASATLKPEVTPRSFDISAVKCGQWTYSGRSLVFSSYWSCETPGRIVFGPRNLLIKLCLHPSGDYSHQLLIPFSTIRSFTIGAKDRSLTFSLYEPPRMQRYTELFLHDSLSKLGTSLEDQLLKLTLSHQGENFKRERVCALDDSHERVVGSCLCYRFILQDPSDVRNIQGLKRFSEIPQSISSSSVEDSHRHFVTGMSYLNDALANTYTTMSFDAKFQLQKFAQNGYLPPDKVIELLPHVAKCLTVSDVTTVASALRYLGSQLPFAGPDTDASEMELQKLKSMLQQSIETVSASDPYASVLADQHEHIMLVHKAFVSPAGIYLEGPEPEVGNRVLRKYSTFQNYFLSVTFADEDREKLRFDRQTSSEKIYSRYRKVLEHVINIAGRGYEFLGFSHSSLRANTTWFMAPFVLDDNLLYARAVIKDLGDFTIFRSPAKCAARIGQAFSQTLSSTPIPQSALYRMPDVERNGYIFSDGVGTCSRDIMKKIWERYSRRRAHKPTIFQIRFQGAKGVISLDTRLPDNCLCLRASMVKFEVSPSSSAEIEICGAANKPLPMFLNRPLIKILEDLGVPDQSFMDLQAEVVENLRMTTLSPINASTFFARSHIGMANRLPWLIRKLDYCGLHFNEDDFLRNTLEMAVLVELREIKHRSRIRVEQGITVYGIMDETGVLQEGEIYCAIYEDRGPRLLTGEVVITRSPAMHPGDVQCVQAVDVPPDNPLKALHNLVAFSQHGQRDLPSQLSGGDIDGDLYNIIYDHRLFTSRTVEAADYTAAKPIDIQRPVERSDMTNFFLHFMENDNLGMIATLHQILADQSPSGTFDPQCIRLAGLHSTAVDYSKTGIAVSITELPKYPKYRPDFQAPGPQVLIEDKAVLLEQQDVETPPDGDDEFDEAAASGPQRHRYYASEKILGKLYRDIDEHQFFAKIKAQSGPTSQENRSIIPRVWKYVEEKTRLIQWKHHTDFALSVMESYEENLVGTMTTYGSNHHTYVTELEVFSGSILGNSKGAQSRQQRESSVTMKEKFDRDVAYIVNWITENEDEGLEALERSIACLFVAFENIRKGAVRRKVGKLVSFAYVAAAVCLAEVEKLHGDI